MIITTKEFTDFDGIKIPKGTAVGMVVRCGWREKSQKFFYNGITDGKVDFVTLGKPSVKHDES